MLGKEIFRRLIGLMECLLLPLNMCLHADTLLDQTLSSALQHPAFLPAAYIQPVPKNGDFSNLSK